MKGNQGLLSVVKTQKIQAEIVKKKRAVAVISWMLQISNAVRYPYLTSAMILAMIFFSCHRKSRGTMLCSVEYCKTSTRQLNTQANI